MEKPDSHLHEFIDAWLADGTDSRDHEPGCRSDEISLVKSLDQVEHCLEFLETVWPSDETLQSVPARKKGAVDDTVATGAAGETSESPSPLRSGSLTTGSQLGQYEILEQLGAGGMGTVFKARHVRLGKVVALKVLSEKKLGNDAAISRFRREIAAVGKLTHPNIVAAHDADEADGIHFLVMEYVAGTDLSALVKESGPLPVAEALGTTAQIARGLQYAHSRGIVHRDIKPSNIVAAGPVGGLSQIKLLDLGLARVADDPVAGDTDLTHSGMVMGTVDYMAPEQAIDSKTADERSDIYSLGATLFFLLTGRVMYPQGSVLSRLLSHREAEIPRLSEFRDDVSKTLETVFARMVAKTHEDRFASMDQVTEALAALASGSADTAAVTGDKSFLGHGRLIVWMPVVIIAATVATVAFRTRRPTEFDRPGDSIVTSRTNDEAVNTQSVPMSGPDFAHEREVAEWVLSVGGSVSVRHDNGHNTVHSIDALPEGDLRISNVWLQRLSRVADADMPRFRGLWCVQQFYLAETRVGDRSIETLVQLPSVTHLELGRTLVTEAALEMIAYQMPQLGSLNLGALDITDSGVATLSRTRLKGLVLHNTQVTDDGVIYLRDMPSLRSINLNYNPRITDASVAVLQKMPQLTQINIIGTAVTRGAIEDLRHTLPHCSIYSDHGAFEPPRGRLFGRPDDQTLFDDPVLFADAVYTGRAPLTLETWFTPKDVRLSYVLSVSGVVHLGTEPNSDRNRIRATVTIDESRQFVVYSEQAYSPGEQIHAALVFDGSALTLFVNGMPQSGNSYSVIDGEMTLLEELPPLDLVPAWPGIGTAIGSNYPNKNPETLLPFTGHIAEARVTRGVHFKAGDTPQRSRPPSNDTLVAIDFSGPVKSEVE